jgi:hypothetical protein
MAERVPEWTESTEAHEAKRSALLLRRLTRRYHRIADGFGPRRRICDKKSIDIDAVLGVEAARRSSIAGVGRDAWRRLGTDRGV